MSFIGVFFGVLLLGVVIYASMWWQGWTGLTLRITKWYFIIFTVLAIIAALYDAFVGLDSLL
ncbi:hypothetical protein [Paenibacillus oryzisoli]|uniref:Uncharacterized protein n=1 Tax=Paenibacillus oryzisoli TaxID=1850517 RepID=A0A198AA12_9BACL|nr:hypothetical protein [Paenibacillus oryzisoli]OAS17997.1 hypothetical protein A8708_28730 [Paenibacillus oryzisoli]